ncbi:MAG: TonB-dependent receptor [Bacteroidota bacterium]|nr:TonB-dependent receptor [Bacteroidota bacterium]
MKKKLMDVFRRNPMAQKILLAMRLTLFLMVLSVFSAYSSSYAQKTKLNLKVQNTQVKEVLNQIENQSEFFFMFDNKQVDVERKVNLEVSSMNINQVLQKLFEGSGVNFRIVNRQILLFSENTNSAFSQQANRVSGKVTDSSGASLPGVSVVIKGTTNGTITDGNGNYSLSNVPENATLQFSFVGMKMQEIAVGGKSIIDVTLEEETVGIEEVVAIGYGTVRKKDLTGSVGSIGAKNIKDLTVSNPSQALQGQIAGVDVKQTSATPGGGTVIRVRGAGSISASSSPLYVVDGYPLGDQNLNAVNPNDIESIEILKDASAAAIYGSRGANGVVLITTKSGKSGKLNINFDTYAGIQQVGKKMGVLNRDEFIEYSKEAFNTNYTNKVSGASATDPLSLRPSASRYKYPGVFDTNPSGLPDTDWQDEIFRSAPVQNYQLSLSGGDNKTQYMFSGGYYDQKGVVINTDYQRYNVRAKVETKLNDFLKMGVNLSSFYSQENRLNEGHWASDGVVLAALATSPVVPVYNADGTYGSQAVYAVQSDGLTGVTNAVANSKIKNYYTTARVLANMFAEIDLYKGLKFKTTIGGDIVNVRRTNFRPSTVPANGVVAPLPSTYRSGIASTNQNFNWLNENTFSYSTIFGSKHALDALAGFTVQKNIWDSNEASGSDFPDDIIQTVGVAKVKTGTSDRSEWSMVSYLGRVNYRYLDRYYLTASIRTDGSSRFGKNKKYGYFPSASLAWRASEEAFMKEINWIRNLKVRASYGLTGNNSISGGNYASIGLISTDNYVFGSGVGSVVSGASQSTIQNDDLSWEKTKQLDIGLEFNILSDKIFFAADYYNRLTTDLLLQVDVPAITGYTTAWQNIGEMRNAGFEFSVSSRIISKAKFTWNTSFNISFNKNEVLALGPQGDPIRSNGGVGDTHITMIGEPIGNFYGYEQIGVYMNAADLANNPKEGTSKVGDVKYRDVSGDEVINANDRTIIGNNHPDFTYGFNNSFTFKSFDLSVLLYGSQGAEILHLAKRFYENLEGNQQQLSSVLNRWKSEAEPGNGIIPRANSLTTGLNNAVSSRWVEDGSFLKISNITLGYNLPANIAQRIKMQAARVYLSGQNLYTFTKYSGYNPEVSFTGDNVLAPGSDYGGYPTARIVSIGFNFTF